MDEIKKGVYEHYKGKRYEVLDVAIHTETQEPMVIYKALYKGNFPEGTLWARPLAMFKENVTVDGKLMPRFRILSSFLVMFILLFSFNCHASQVTLIQGATKRIITDGELAQKLNLSQVEVDDPVYQKHKHYAGYWLSEILNLAGIHLGPDDELVFTALDGYKARITNEDLLKSHAKAFVAVKDLDAAGGWEKINQGKEWISPGPFYLVWQTSSNTPEDIKLPWPYQIFSITVDDADILKQELFPEGPDRSESVARGYKIFRQSCIACHSLNLEGGVLGPELNVPKNILEYRNRKVLREFISDPSSFRARDKMPAFDKTLSRQSIEDVLDYLAWMGKYKI